MLPHYKETEKTKANKGQVSKYKIPDLNCDSCGRPIWDHPSYLGSVYPVYGKDNCPFRFVDLH